MSRDPKRIDGYAPVRDYGAIGDQRSLALVALDGAIDWLCLPAFDGPPVFSALLDSRRGGRLELCPDGPFSAEHRYLPDTNVLESTYTTADGVLRVTDALAIDRTRPLPWSELTRRVECLSGAVPIRWRVAPRFGWAFAHGRARTIRGAPVIRHGPDAVAVLTWELGEPVLADGEVRGATGLENGDRGLLAVCSFNDSPLLLSSRTALEGGLDETVRFWERWSSLHRYDGTWGDAVLRSALALQLLVFDATGAMAAAGTAALPEALSGGRNWDYRYAWTRDTAFALEAMLRLGSRYQVHASFSYLLRASSRSHPRLRAFYGLDGGPGRVETEPVDCDGYRSSSPVVIGNRAARQRQLGNYGDLVQTAWLYVRDGNALDPASGVRMAELADFVTQIWRRPDASIWELTDYRDYTQGKLAAWLALTRAVQLAETGDVPAANSGRWHAEAQRVRRYIDGACWSDERSSYMRAPGSTELDAGVLLAARASVAYLEPGDPRLTGTIEALRRELGRGPLLYRYSGMDGEEGAFLACSFWLAEALAQAGELDAAAELMDELLALANDVGLYSEEMDPESGDMLGNFPQALTHLSLVNAACVINERLGGSG